MCGAEGYMFKYLVPKKNMSFIQTLMSDKSYCVCNVDMLDGTKPYNTVSFSRCYSLEKGQ